MPAVPAIFSSGVSVGLLAGVVSGLFYLVVAGIRWAGEVRQQSGEWFYRQVQRRFQPALAARADEGDDGAMEEEAGRVRDFVERLVEALVAGGLDDVCVRRLHAHPLYERMFACHHARLCEALARLSFALQMAVANKHMDGHDSPSAAHAALKQLIQQIIQEAMTLPNFKGLSPRREDDEDQELEDMESKTYEDILATAILNKVIERYQQSAGQAALDGNSNLLSPELMSLVAMHKPKFVNGLEIGANSSRSSDDGKMFTSDGDSLSELSNTDPLAVTIEECIEEVTTFNAEEDDEPESYAPGLDIFKNRRAPFPEYGRDIVDAPPVDIREDSEEEEEDDDDVDEDSSLQPTDMINPVDSWEENWLFQKKRLKVGGVPQPMPVPMLVPNPSEDFRALIGDRDAEDVSDLSECSDGALEDLVLADEDLPLEEPITPVNSVNAVSIAEDRECSDDNNIHASAEGTEAEQPEEPNVEGKPAIMQSDSLDGELPYDEADLTEAKNLEFLKASDDCLSEFGQQEGEYTEDYAAVTQRQLDSLTALSEPSEPETSEIPELPTSPVPQLSSCGSEIDESIIAILDELVPSENAPEETSENKVLANPPRPGTDPSDDEHCTLPAPGTIAEREHKKWETAPPLPNNPYSPENIYKRLNKNTIFTRVNSGSDTSMDFPELNDSSVAENIVDKPLQIICSPSDVDYKRYGRDYYINAQSPDNKKHQKNSSEPPQEMQGAEQEENTLNFNEDQINEEPQHVDKKVALWQKEINHADQYYKNIRNKNHEPIKKTYDQKSEPNNTESQAESTVFMKSMLNVSDKHGDSKLRAGVRHRSIKSQENARSEPNDYPRRRRSDLNIGDSEFATTGVNHRLSAYENASDTFSNGYSRSDSPSGSSVVTTDSDYSMPSVRELTKRFSSMAVDSDSSASRSKSVSPAPRWRSQEHLLEPPEPQEKKRERPLSQSSLSPPRPVREIHSLTARSISKEFREELRHNQPVPLNRNVYKPGNPRTTGSVNDLTEETSGSSRRASKSPVPARSMQSSIAFWEQLQKHNT